MTYYDERLVVAMERFVKIAERFTEAVELLALHTADEDDPGAVHFARRNVIHNASGGAE